jgi:hypothetical protein
MYYSTGLGMTLRVGTYYLVLSRYCKGLGCTSGRTNFFDRGPAGPLNDWGPVGPLQSDHWGSKGPLTLTGPIRGPRPASREPA